MNYTAWSELIYKYYFERHSDARVVLHITLQDLVDFAKEENVEIAKGRYASEFKDDFIKRDFVCKFWINIKDRCPSIEDFKEKLLALKHMAKEEHNYKYLLPIIAILIMPICENDALELHGNDYYGHLLPFLFSNGFINKKANNDGNLLQDIALDEIWNCINKWAESESLAFKSSQVVSGNGRRHYVRSLMKESLLSPSHLQKFCIIFEKGGLAPKVNIENDRLLSAFRTNYQYIGLSIGRYNQLVGKEFKEYLISVLRKEYDHWDGTTKIKERDPNTGRIKIKSDNTYYPLLLMMDFDVNSRVVKFGFHLYCPDMDDMDDMHFIADNSEVDLPLIYIKSDGYANRPFYIENNIVNRIFKDRNGVYEIHEENLETIKGRFVVSDYYLLRVYQNKYIATNEFIKGKFYFIVVRKDVIELFTEWLKGNSAEFVSDCILGGNYCLYRINCAIMEMPQRNNLRFNSDLKCKSVNNIEVKTAENQEVILLSNLFPAHFEISGVDVAKDKIYAVSVNSENRYSQELIYDQKKSVWILSVSINTEFVLYCNESRIPYGHTYKFSDFILPKSFKEVKLDKWGKTNGKLFSLGLTLPDEVANKNLINWSLLKEQMEDAPIKTIVNNTYKETDYLLYAITSASYQTDSWLMNMKWIKSIRDRIVSELEDKGKESQPDRFALKNLLADYFRMGYINYAYTENGLCITANHPTLILLVPEYKRDILPGADGRNIVRRKCIERKYKCLLSGGRTISLIKEIERYQLQYQYELEIKCEDNSLMPQTIYLYAEERDSFKKLAEKLNLKYQDNIYSNALLETLPSVEEYIEEITSNGVERDLFMVKSFRAIDYKRMAELYPEKLKLGRYLSNAEIDKRNFDKNKDFVIFFPGTKDEVSVLIHDGQMKEVDKYWGHFIGMRYADAKVLIYDKERAQISMPQQLRLPLLYARALTMLTGQTPESTLGSRAYNIGVNPCTDASASSPDTILKKLGQI